MHKVDLPRMDRHLDTMQTMIPFPDISPDIFSVTLFGIEFALRWYALAYITGIVLGWRLVVQAIKTPALWPAKTPAMTTQQVEDFLTWAVFGIILGGRLGYVLFYKFSYYLEYPQEILMVWQGGMSFHGGFLGVVLAAYLYCLKYGLNKHSVSDTVALAVPAGLFLGRIANFINAELWGRPTDLPWGVVFPGNMAQSCGPLVEICARHPSQLYEAALEGLVLGGLIIWLVWRKEALRFPGRVAGTFFAGYGIARFIVEFVRQPDAHFVSDGNPLGLYFQVSGYGLTMGQLLSLPMILIGLWLIATSRKRRT